MHLVLFFLATLAVVCSVCAEYQPTRTIPLQQLYPRSNNNGVMCSPGTYSSTRYTPCTNCDAGTFTKESGQTSCLAARAGYYVASAAATTETPCPSGSYSPSQSSNSCSSCPPGYKCPSSALSNPQGCSGGTYSTGGAITCPPCPVGKFNNIERATGCCDCPAGWFNGHAGNANCQQCSNQAPYSDPGAGEGGCYTPARRYAISSSASQRSDGSCPSSTLLTISSPKARRRVAHAPLCGRLGQKACPVFGFNWRASPHHRSTPYECVDIASDLFSCGGCVTYAEDGKLSADGGRDCSSIPNVSEVRCQSKNCLIESCKPGFILSANGQHCVPDL